MPAALNQSTPATDLGRATRPSAGVLPRVRRASGSAHSRQSQQRNNPVIPISPIRNTWEQRSSMSFDKHLHWTSLWLLSSPEGGHRQSPPSGEAGSPLGHHRSATAHPCRINFLGPPSPPATAQHGLATDTPRADLVFRDWCPLRAPASGWATAFNSQARRWASCRAT